MYVCCGQVCWSFDDQGAGAIQGQASPWSRDRGGRWWGGLAQRCNNWKTAGCGCSGTHIASMAKPELKDKILSQCTEWNILKPFIPEMKQHYKSYLEEGGDSGEGYKERALGLELLRLRIIERRLCSIEFWWWLFRSRQTSVHSRGG